VGVSVGRKIYWTSTTNRDTCV